MFKTLNIIETTLKRNQHMLLFVVVLFVIIYMITVIYFICISFANKEFIYALDNAGNTLVFRQVHENPLVEARGQFKDFHCSFFNLPPDGKQIQENIREALNLADKSAEVYYNTFKENHYYNKLIAANISQTLKIDSISISPELPHKCKLFGKLILIRSSQVIERKIVTRGQLRRTQRSRNNPHGFLIERFEILEIKDLRTYNRE